MGCGDGHMIVVETLDRDAGYWETRKYLQDGTGNWVLMEIPCPEIDGRRGRVYWDETDSALTKFPSVFPVGLGADHGARPAGLVVAAPPRRAQ